MDQAVAEANIGEHCLLSAGARAEPRLRQRTPSTESGENPGFELEGTVGSTPIRRCAPAPGSDAALPKAPSTTRAGPSSGSSLRDARRYVSRSSTRYGPPPSPSYVRCARRACRPLVGRPRRKSNETTRRVLQFGGSDGMRRSTIGHAEIVLGGDVGSDQPGTEDSKLERTRELRSFPFLVIVLFPIWRASKAGNSSSAGVCRHTPRVSCGEQIGRRSAR